MDSSVTPGTSPRTIRRKIARRVTDHMIDLSRSCESTKSRLICSYKYVNTEVNAISADVESCSSISSGESSSNSFLPNSVDILNDCSSEINSDDTKPSLSEFKELLVQWILKHNITTTAVSDLLKMLRNFEPFSALPKDGRTLLKTKNQAIVSVLGDGKYSYFGIEKNIKAQLLELPSEIINSNRLDLEISVDGLPISKSTRAQLWPIQCSVVNVEQDLKPFVVAIYYGNSKPNDVSLYFEPLLQELRTLMQTGMILNSNFVKIRLVRIIADAPARAFVKQCKIHNSYHSCEKCTERGQFKGRVIFPNHTSEVRSDESFKLQVDKDHHTGVSPFTSLNFGLVSGAPLDYMHLVCLGVTKKLLKAWVKGPLPYKIKTKDIITISTSLSNLSRTCPNEFNRKPRTLKELDLWKATEFRSFLLYTGPVVLKRVLSSKLYNHFMIFSTAIRILASPCATNLEWNTYADKLLQKFVSLIPTLYSQEFLVYNVHSLVHLCKDAMKHGPLDKFSAFKYENNMQVIKRTLTICQFDHLSK